MAPSNSLNRCWLIISEVQWQSPQGNSIRHTITINRIFKISFRVNELTHWGWDKMAAKFLTTISNAFSWMKIVKFWLLFLLKAWHRPGHKPLSEPMFVSLLMHICVTQPQIVNILFRYTTSVLCLSPFPSFNLPFFVDRRHGRCHGNPQQARVA